MQALEKMQPSCMYTILRRLKNKNSQKRRLKLKKNTQKAERGRDLQW